MESVNIRPGVSILSVLRHLNYRPWFAIAEFVDNSIQSYISNVDVLRQVQPEFRLKIEIEYEGGSSPRLIVRDNAAGIGLVDFPRAFRAAQLPPDRSGLAEFGMGMKSAACWFSPLWSVRTSALDESIERTVRFDIAKIVEDNLEELEVDSRPVVGPSHYTEVVLENLYRPLHSKTVSKIREHLSGIYRMFLRENELDIVFNGECLEFVTPTVLVTPYFRDLQGESIRWHKEIELDFGLGWRVSGFAGLRDVASVSNAGFALFRRRRLIQGSADETYRPETIFGKSNSYVYQRLFGEFSIEGFEVSHTKDGFQWDGHEELLVDELKKELDAEPIRLLVQADGFRARQRYSDIRAAAESAVTSTASVVQRETPGILASQSTEVPDQGEILSNLDQRKLAAERIFLIDFEDQRWLVRLQVSNDISIGDWLSISQRNDTSSATPGLVEPDRTLGIRLNMAHPFMVRFAGSRADEIEPLLRVAVGLALAETTARDVGVKYAGAVRRRLNELLREALSKP